MLMIISLIFQSSLKPQSYNYLLTSTNMEEGTPQHSRDPFNLDELFREYDPNYGSQSSFQYSSAIRQNDDDYSHIHEQPTLLNDTREEMVNNSNQPENRPLDTFQGVSQTVQSSSQMIIRKRKIINKNQHRPNQNVSEKKNSLDQKTKNILPFFKKAHQQYMKKYLANHPQRDRILNDEDIIRIFKPNLNHINMKDYECLYRKPELQECWRAMLFRHKYLHHHLMVGKNDLSQRMTYRTKICCFQRAYERGVFDNIN